VTAGGLVPPKQVLIATYASFGVSVLCGIYLVTVAGWQLLLVGAASILAGVLYTGGPRPYGYEGLGEVFVFLFFGIVAVTGTFYAQVKGHHLPWEAFALAVPVGLLASAVLVVNNVRDMDTDRRAGKKTLAVRLGRERTRLLYAALVYVAYLLAPVTWLFGPFKPWLLLAWLSLPLAVPLVRIVRNRTDGASLNEALAGTGRLQFVYCVLLAIGLLLS
jgi:1,4-dihydroxy-2-naphthoate octaprenyltransferase